MPDDLYDRDILIWSEQQADLLRRLATGERLNDQVDWENLIDEVASVGKSQRDASESAFRQAFVHLLKLHAAPSSRPASHWKSEILQFLFQAQQSFTPSMRGRIDLEQVYRRALRQVGPLILEDEGFSDAENRRLHLLGCPYDFDELLDTDADPSALVAKLGAP